MVEGTMMTMETTMRNSGGNNRRNKDDDGNDSNNKTKGACEEPGHVFDCMSCKQNEACNETLKATAKHVATNEDFGKDASDAKCVMECLKDPDSN